MSVNVAAHLVRVQINREPLTSPSPTKGHALYKLGEIPEGQELFLELEAEEHDQFIPNDNTVITLNEGDHFYSQKTFEIFVNTEQNFIVEKRLDYNEVIKLAFPTPPPGTAIHYKVHYRKGPKVNPKGSLVQGQSVKLKDGMIFDVTPADRS